LLASEVVRFLLLHTIAAGLQESVGSKRRTWSAKVVRWMARLVVGLFAGRQAAEIAIGTLAGQGFRRNQISVVRRAGTSPDELAVGGGFGSLHVLLEGVTALPLAGIGSALVAGPLAAFLPCPSASGPQVPADLVAALKEAGMATDGACSYTRGLCAGCTLVAVHAEGESVAELTALLARAGAMDGDWQDRRPGDHSAGPLPPKRLWRR
jgi:hypothetical protein